MAQDNEVKLITNFNKNSQDKENDSSIPTTFSTRILTAIAQEKHHKGFDCIGHDRCSHFSYTRCVD